MVSHTAEEIIENTWRKCEQAIYAGLVHAKKVEPDNTWGQAREQARYLASIPLLEALSLVVLLNSYRLTPSASCRTSQPKDGEQGRSEIGGHLNTEVRPAGQL